MFSKKLVGTLAVIAAASIASASAIAGAAHPNPDLGGGSRNAPVESTHVPQAHQLAKVQFQDFHFT
jgi:alpha/beta superfamily hydrolase